MRWSELSAHARVVVALLAAIVLVGALTLVAAAGTDDGTDAVTTADASSTSQRSTTTTSSTVPSPVVVTDPITGRTTIAVPVTSTVAPPTTSRSGAKPTTTTSSARATTTTEAPVTTKAPTTTAPAPTCAATSTNAAANELAADYCSYRARNGLAPMKRTSGLDAMAQEWAQHMADSQALQHRSPEAVRAGVQAACKSCVRWAENVAYNPTADASWRAWLNSPSHKANIDRDIPGEFGMGAAYAGGYWWVVQNFGHYA